MQCCKTVRDIINVLVVLGKWVVLRTSIEEVSLGDQFFYGMYTSEIISHIYKGDNHIKAWQQLESNQSCGLLITLINGYDYLHIEYCNLLVGGIVSPSI